MNEREKIIHLWFDMWLQQKDLGIDEIFTDDVIYIESWSPKYENRVTVKHWFKEWNTRGKVLVWDIKQFFHKENQTIVEWYFKNKMDGGCIEEFDGISLVEWTTAVLLSYHLPILPSALLSFLQGTGQYLVHSPKNRFSLLPHC